jgi:non-specific serine/threonine protein kinase
MSLIGFKYVELAFILANQGEFDRARALCEEFRRVCLAHGERWVHSYLLRVESFAEWAQGERVPAGVHARECLQLKREVGDVFGIAITLELLAAVQVEDGEGRRAAVLLGASGRIWQDTGSTMSRTQSHGPVRSEAEARARALLGETAFARAYREGLQLSCDDAVGYALDESATTGPGRSPLDQQLTRREVEVAELVAQGLTNQQIADRLVLARRTAEHHVERILLKLGFTSRSQLAVWADTRRAVHL